MQFGHLARHLVLSGKHKISMSSNQIKSCHWWYFVLTEIDVTEYCGSCHVSDWICAVSSEWTPMEPGGTWQHHVYHHVLLLALCCGSADRGILLLRCFLVRTQSFHINQSELLLISFVTAVCLSFPTGFQTGVQEGRWATLSWASENRLSPILAPRKLCSKNQMKNRWIHSLWTVGNGDLKNWMHCKRTFSSWSTNMTNANYLKPNQTSFLCSWRIYYFK